MTGRALAVANLTAGYGSGRVLFGVDLSVASGEFVALLGRNGMGKTTTVRSIMGLLRPDGGRVTFGERELAGRRAFEVARAGIGLVPEQRQIFGNLSVLENLTGTAANRLGLSPAWTLDRIFAMFPILKERSGQPAWSLSGGEQQMLAIGRALLTNPALLILDEATEGLAPLIREQIWASLRDLRGRGLSMLVIDRDIDALIEIADRHYVMEKGRIVWTGSSAELRRSADVIDRYVGVGAVDEMPEVGGGA